LLKNPTILEQINKLRSELRVAMSNYAIASSSGGTGWASDANTGVNAFIVGNGVKTELIDYAVRTNYKSARTVSQFNKLRSTQQVWRTTNTPTYGTAWSIGWNLGQDFGPSTWYGKNNYKWFE